MTSTPSLSQAQSRSSPSPAVEIPTDPLAPISIDTHTFSQPQKRIHTHDDLPTFHKSLAYARITAFLQLLNAAVTPISTSPPTDYRKLQTDSPDIQVSKEVQGIIDLVRELEALIAEVPPLEGPRRFGNAAFRTWHKTAEERILRGDMFERHLPTALNFKSNTSDAAKSELASYLLGSFGSEKRLDYGTGHELAFLAFLGAIYLLGGFKRNFDEPALATKCLDAYLSLIRKLVKTYNLEPAGSHGVWGLDDHSFLPYIFGSAQLTTYPVGGDDSKVPLDIPKAADVVKKPVVQEWRNKNLYFGAVGFINDVKTGPFWEHSPILYDVSGVPGGWPKINQGMQKMYAAEVLGKFPVVQHFHFGSLFPWPYPYTPPADESSSSPTPTQQPASTSLADAPTRAPWAKPGALPPTTTTTVFPRANPSSSSSSIPQRFDDNKPSQKPSAWVPTAAPWASTTPAPPSTLPASSAATARADAVRANRPGVPASAPDAPGGGGSKDNASGPIMTKAPWAK